MTPFASWSPFRARRGVLAGLCFLTVVACTEHTPVGPAAAPSFHRAAPPGATFDWAMPARFGSDRDADGLIDYARTLEDVHPASWTVDFDACQIDAGGESTRYKWYVDHRPVAFVSSCTYSHQFPSEGRYDVALHVIRVPGPGVWAEQTVTVQDWLVVSFGDSYASGEGVPEVQAASDALLVEIDQAVRDLVLARQRLAAAQAALQQAFENKGLAESILATQQQRLADFLNACLPDSFKSIQRCVDFLLGLPFETFQTARDHFQQAVTDAQERVNSLTQAWQNAQAAFNAAQSAVTHILDVIAQLRAGLQAARWQPNYAGQDWRQPPEDDCHRSANSAPARAALALERDDPRTSVTFVQLACSGAQIDEQGGNLQDQIALANQLVGEREIDAVLVSIGGNDAGFANIGTACVVQQPCYVDDPAFDPADASGICVLLEVVGSRSQCDAFFANFPQSAKLILEQGVAALPGRYAKLADQYLPTLAGLLEPLPASGAGAPVLDPVARVRTHRVYLTEYGDLTKDDQGAYCRFDNTDPLGAMPGVTVDEMQWLDQIATRSIDDAVAAATAAHGWTLVGGIYRVYHGHGYCAQGHWVNRLHEALLRQGDYKGVLHPNNPGQVASAAAIVAVLLNDLYPEGPAGAPRAPDQPFSPGAPIATIGGLLP